MSEIFIFLRVFNKEKNQISLIYRTVVRKNIKKEEHYLIYGQKIFVKN